MGTVYWNECKVSHNKEEIEASFKLTLSLVFQLKVEISQELSKFLTIKEWRTVYNVKPRVYIKLYPHSLIN